MIIFKFEYEKTSPSVFYPCHKVIEEDRKNGDMVMYGLPEGTYNIVIDGTYYSFSPVIIKSQIKKMESQMFQWLSIVTEIFVFCNTCFFKLFLMGNGENRCPFNLAGGL